MARSPPSGKSARTIRFCRNRKSATPVERPSLTAKLTTANSNDNFPVHLWSMLQEIQNPRNCLSKNLRISDEAQH
jgi:hypothetical protein